MDAPGQLAQLLQSVRELLGGLGEQPVGLGGVVADTCLREAEDEGKRDQPLLGTVVEVALEPPALVVGGLDDAPAPASEWLPYLAACAGAKPPLRVDAPE